MKHCASLILILLILQSGFPLKADTSRAFTPRAFTKAYAPNRILPEARPHSLTLSSHPTDSEIASIRIFAEPLLRVGEQQDNSELAELLRDYLERPDPTDTSRISAFARKQSGWQASLLANIGSVERDSGFFTRALATWREAWMLTKASSDSNAQSIANYVAGELAETLAHLGKLTECESLLKELEARQLYGSTTQKVVRAREALWLIRNRPENSFRCGLLALASISPSKDHFKLERYRAGKSGLSLTELEHLSHKTGQALRMAQREAGGEFAVPSIIHWRVDHYSALVDRQELYGRVFYLVDNPLFEGKRWVSREALEEETTGYALISTGALPAGWRAVTPSEGSSVYGRCATSASDDREIKEISVKVKRCVTLEVKGKIIKGLASYNIHAMPVSLNITDTPVGYLSAVGAPVSFQLTYNQREASQPNTFNYSNLGHKWTFGWFAYVVDQGSNTASPRRVTVYLRGGGEEDYDLLAGTTGEYERNLFSLTTLVRTGRDTYERRFADGSKEVYGQSDGARINRKVFLTQIVDPQGRAITFSYDERLRLVAARDSLGLVTTLSYDSSSDPLKLTSVTDPFGRVARFEYGSNGRLTRITDVLGLTSEFTYGNNDLIDSLKTPYGTTRFSAGESTSGLLKRWLEATDPTGETERVEFNNESASLAPNEPVAPVGVFNSDLNTRNTFYWDKKAFKAGASDFRNALIWHWLASPIRTTTSGVVDSIKIPLEHRIWYRYKGQRDNTIYSDESIQPSRVARILPDGTSQETLAEYNEAGQLTKTIDPVGRTTTLIYEGVDLVEVRQGSDRLTRITYSDRHLPVQVEDEAGLLTRLEYNEQGQLTAKKTANGQITLFSYNSEGRLAEITGLEGRNRLGFLYDRFGRAATLLMNRGYSLQIEYDLLDRPTKVTYPDQSTETAIYERLDLVQLSDRQGRVTRYGYDSLGRITSVTDAQGKTSSYRWCGCEDLEAVTDAQGKTTAWSYDIAGKLIAKRLSNGREYQYQYEAGSDRISRIIDPKRQVTELIYTVDDQLRQVSHRDTKVATPSLQLDYDKTHNRLVSIQDGAGTTNFSYHPAGRAGALEVATVDGPLENDTISYDYDLNGRIVKETLAGEPTIFSYDALGQLTEFTSPLGRFGLSYAQDSGKLSAITYPNGQKMRLSYFDIEMDERVRELRYEQEDGQLLSRFEYGYGRAGEIESLTQGLADATSRYTYDYDATGQLQSATLTADSRTTSYGYTYDAAGNRLTERIDSSTTSFTYNQGDELIAIVGQTRKTLTYDENGNLSSDGTSSYEWDANDRLTAVVTGKFRTEYSYDGLGHCVRIVERKKKKVLSERRLVWHNDILREERDAQGRTTRRFYGLGEQINGQNYYYTRDHLGSVRELTDTRSRLVARYNYDPFGRTTKTAGNSEDASFGFAGYGLRLQKPQAALFRQYDPNLGRWLSRDPASDPLSPNGFTYAANNPVNFTDPSGLFLQALPLLPVLIGGIEIATAVLVAILRRVIARFIVRTAIPFLVTAARFIARNLTLDVLSQAATNALSSATGTLVAGLIKNRGCIDAKLIGEALKAGGIGFTAGLLGALTSSFIDEVLRSGNVGSNLSRQDLSRVSIIRNLAKLVASGFFGAISGALTDSDPSISAIANILADKADPLGKGLPQPGLRLAQLASRAVIITTLGIVPNLQIQFKPSCACK